MPQSDGQPADAGAVLTADDMRVLADHLLSATKAQADSSWSAAELRLSQIFSEVYWGVDTATNQFTEEGLLNLYKTEISTKFREWLGGQGIDGQGYSRIIYPVQYNSIQIWLKSVFGGAQKSNKGWRMRLVGFPSLGTIAIGICSNYQGTQNQNQMALASSLIRQAALDVLPAGSAEIHSLSAYSSATSEHWDGRGLMPEPVLRLGELDISEYEPSGAQLRMARNTTVKKELSTFFCIEGMGRGLFESRGDKRILDIRDIAAALGEKVAE